ncbi:MAG: PBECR2 nuclease fold domain-containing protein [Clostridium sp.]|nr:PBECR2 nuclease fold domain-containing protein [Clostridium sp.]
MSRKKIGTFSPKIIEALGLNIPAGTPIYISDSNIAHMKTSHPGDFEKYSADIETILSDPDYVGKNLKDNSIEFTKEYILNGDFVKVAIRVSLQNVYYARSLYTLNPERVKNFISKGTLKRLDN